jgi:predicted SprT family Zn-dependent metalloprotease
VPIVFWKNKEIEFRRVEEALGLIKKYDQLRYNRLMHDLERIWVVPLSGAVGAFDTSTGSCKLDPRIVLAEPPETIAAVIVHEATHARLHRCGIRYEEDERGRVEAACIRRELAFAAKLPGGEWVREQAARYLESCANPEHWSDASISERHLNAAVQTLRYVGFPDWLAGTAIALRDVILGMRRFVRGLVIRRRF